MNWSALHVPRFSRAGVAIPALLFLGSLTACDPCAGVVGCDGDPRISLEGQLVVHSTRQPAPGVELMFVRTGGASLITDTIFATTDEAGRFLLTGQAMESGEVVGQVHVRPPDRPGYVVKDISVQTTTVVGDGNILGERWVVDPYFDFLGELYSKGSRRPIGVHSDVVFRRTSGLELVSDTFAAQTDFDGRFTLTPEPVGHGEVVGDITVRGVIDDRFQVRTIRDVRLETTFVERPLGVRGVWYLGRTLSYLGEIRYRAQYRPAAGEEVRFTRTGGVETDPSAVTVITDNSGRFPLRFFPADDGTLIGTLDFELEGPIGRVSIPGYRLPTTDTDEVVRLPPISLGPGLNYVGEIRGERTGNAIVGSETRLIRLDGVEVEEATYVSRTDENGRFRMSPFPLESGVYAARLVVDLPGTEPDFIVDVGLDTFETDEVRLAGVWYVPGL